MFKYLYLYLINLYIEIQNFLKFDSNFSEYLDD